jgi:hypothetical protein
MASTYSQYKIELVGTGEQAGTWGTTTNNNFGSATPGTYQGFEQAIGGRADVTMSGTTTLSLTNSNAAQDARALYLNLSGTLSGAADLVVPALQKSYLVKNGTTGGFAVTIKVTGQTGVSIPNGKTVWVYNNGTDIVTAVDFIPEIATTTVDATNIEVTNIKAKDGTSAGSIADSTGVVTLASSVLTTTDINGGTIDGAVIGGASAAAGSFTTLGASSTATFAAGAVGTPAITTTGDTNTGIFFPAADTIAFAEGGAEAIRIDADGRLLIGNTSSNSAFNSAFQIQGSGVAGTMLVNRFNASTGGPNLYFAKSRSATIGTNTIVNSGDQFGIINFAGANGTGYDTGAQIYAEVDGTPGASGDMPGRLVFSTTPDGSDVPTERMRIDSSGNVGIGTSSPGAKLGLFSNADADFGQKIYHSSSALAANRFPQLEFSQTPIGQAYENRVILRQQNSSSGNFPCLAFITNAAGAGENTRIFLDGFTANVGIGTTSPAQSLDTIGKIRVRDGGNTTTPSIQMGASGVDGFSLPSTNTIAFITNSLERARITSSGELLVGTTAVAGTIANDKPIVAGTFRSLNGSLSSIPSGTPTTMFTMTANFTTYLVTVSGLVSSSSYSETAIIHLNNTAVSVTIIADGALVTIDNSGLDVRFTQSSGVTMADMVFSVMRIM